MSEETKESYKLALELAGAEVLKYEEFGSYQGDWLAKVRYEGKEGWVNDYFGSCSGCDAFLGEFAFSSHKCKDLDYHTPIWDGFTEGCEECDRVKERIIEFGKSYLNNILSKGEILSKVKENIDWDLEAQNMVDFIEKE